MVISMVSLVALSPQTGAPPIHVKPVGRPAIAVDWQVEANARIDKLRKGDFRIQLTGPMGKPMARTTIELEQVNSDFRFGAIVSAEPATTELTRRFNTVTFPDGSEPAKIASAVPWFQKEGVFLRSGCTVPIDTAYAFEVGDATAGDPDLRIANQLAAVKRDHPRAFRAVAVGVGETSTLIGTLKSLDKQGAGFDLVADRGSFMMKPEAMLDRWDALARAGKRIEVFDDGVQENAAALRTRLIAAFSHPSVDGLFLSPVWLFDSEAKSMVETWDALVTREWRTKTTVTTDARGRAVIRGYYGTYRVKVGDWQSLVGHSRYPKGDTVIAVGSKTSQ